jgi:hypothetical protein
VSVAHCKENRGSTDVSVPCAPSDRWALPPARRGDLLRAAADDAAIIGFIDGVFHQDLTLTPAKSAAAQLGVRLF